MRLASSAAALRGRSATQPPISSIAAAAPNASARLRGRRNRCRIVAADEVMACDPLGVAIPSSSCRISSALCGRSAGFFARQAITSSASAEGIAARRLVMGVTGSVTCAASI